MSTLIERLEAYDPKEAHEAYCKKAVELFGEFANFGEGNKSD